MWLAQYEVLREHGHSPSEAFNETVEEATQSLYPLIAEKGMDWMYANCSTTAQRGAARLVQSVSRRIQTRVSRSCTNPVASGKEARRGSTPTAARTIGSKLEKELKEIADSEIVEGQPAGSGAGTAARGQECLSMHLT